jgi:hypothetical protein
VSPFWGEVIFTVTFLAAWACAAGGSNAAAHNASTTTGIDVLTLVISCLQSLPLDATLRGFAKGGETARAPQP